MQRKRKSEQNIFGGGGVHPQSWGGTQKYFFDGFFRKSIQIVGTPSLCLTVTSEKIWGQSEPRGGEPPMTTLKKCHFLHFFRILPAECKIIIFAPN